jgi:RimJ/RimL family protein N-acetyltransferase
MIRLIAILRDGALADEMELSDAAREAIAGNVGHYARAGFAPPWISYLAVEGEACVGCCAFKSAPRDGAVEIAYGTFPPHEGRGVATAMARELIAIAERDGIAVTAQTLPEPNASTRILEKLRFRRDGWAEDDEVGRVWAWRRDG